MSLIKQQPAFNEDYARVSDELAVLNSQESPDELSKDGDVGPCFDFGLVYASQTFAASLEGQVCVLKGDSLEMIDDSNPYWWLVKCVKTSEIGYIPAEIVETPLERLARINKNLNVTLSQVRDNDLSFNPVRSASLSSRSKSVFFDKNSVRHIKDRLDSIDDGLLRKTSVTTISKVLMNKFLPYRKKTRKLRESSGSLLYASNDSIQMNLSNMLHQSEIYERDNIIDTIDSSQRPQSSAVVDVDNTEPISVLRVYAGNTDLKATFKSVTFDKLMTARELLRIALQRFKVPLSMESSYYLGVLHMDSQKKRLNDNDVVYEVFESLRSKHLPGVSGFTRLSKVVNKHGLVSRVLMSDDNIIRVIINKEDAIGSNKMILARTFVRHEGYPHDEEHVYKTLALSKTAAVSEAVSLALKKFRIQPSDKFVSNLYQKTGDVEVFLPNSEILGSVIKDQKDVSENLFVLAIKWTGEGPALIDLDTFPPYNSSSRKSLAADINDILNLKPEFLDEAVSQQSPIVESDTACTQGENCSSNDSQKKTDLIYQNQLRDSINGIFCSMRAYSEARSNLEAFQHQHEMEPIYHRNKKLSDDSDAVINIPDHELAPTIEVINTILDTRDYPSSAMKDTITVSTREPDIDVIQLPVDASSQQSSSHNESTQCLTDANLVDVSSADIDSANSNSRLALKNKNSGSQRRKNGSLTNILDDNLFPKSRSFKHSSTPLPDSSDSLKPPVRKDSNVANLTKAFDTLSISQDDTANSQNESFTSTGGGKMKKRSKSFDAMERYLEEIMSSGCQSNALSELEVKLRMAAIENSSDP